MTKLKNHNEETHAEVGAADQKIERRTAKKRRRMRVTGKGVFVLNTLLRRRGLQTQQSARKRRRRLAVA